MAALDRRAAYADRRYPSPAELVDWVREGVETPGNPADDFQTDGVATSTRRFARPPPRRARWSLTAVDDNWLKGAVFAVVAVLGLLLLPARLPLRALVVGAMVVALVLCGACCRFSPRRSSTACSWRPFFWWPSSGPWPSWPRESVRRPPALARLPGARREPLPISARAAPGRAAGGRAAAGPAKPEDGQPPQNEGGQSEGGQNHA